MAESRSSPPFYDTATPRPANSPQHAPGSSPDETSKPGKAPDLPQPDGDSIHPGRAPDETVHPGGDTDDPSLIPDEVHPSVEQPDQPGSTPDETPPPPLHDQQK